MITLNESIMDNEALLARIVQIEYAKLDEYSLKQMYLEETGEMLDVEINIYYSSDYIDEIEENGFNGTIIHLYDEKQGINQMYNIPRGTQVDYSDWSLGDEWRPNDAVYDLIGVFAGADDTQFKALEQFTNRVTAEIEKNTINSAIELEKNGLGHSLGGVLITMLQLMEGDYNNVNTFNSAAPSVYKMAMVDRNFLNKIIDELNLHIREHSDLYDLNAEKLEAIAEKYYQSNADVISHIVDPNDILEAILSFPGFFEVGEKKYTYSENKDDVGALKEIVEQIPDELVNDLQSFIAKNYGSIYREEGFDGLLEEFLGIHGEAIDEFIEIMADGGPESWQDKAVFLIKIYAVAKRIDEKLPEVLELVEGIRDGLPDFLQAVEEAGYMSKEDIEKVLKQVDGLIEDLSSIQKSASYIINNLSIFNLFEILEHVENIKERVTDMQGKLDVIIEHLDPFLQVLGESAVAHKMGAIIKQLLGNGKKIDSNGDILIKIPAEGNGSSSEIYVNISSAARIFIRGTSFLEQKKDLLRELKSTYEEEYIDDYETRKNIIIGKADDMSLCPSSYQDLLGYFTPDTKYFHKIKRINVDLKLEPLPDSGFKTPFNNLFSFIEKEIKEEAEMLEEFEEAIEKLFEKDKEIGELISV